MPLPLPSSPMQPDKPLILQAVRPNIGLEIAYRKKLQRLIDQMHRDVSALVLDSYEDNPPRTMAQDEAPVQQLKRAFAELSTRWLKRFDKGSQELAAYFGQAMQRRSDAQLRVILAKAGYSVRFQISRAMRDILSATVQQQVSLIKSIPEQYLKNIEGAVMRSVTRGRDMASLKKDIDRTRTVTSRRAAMIARDQNNKATAAMQRERQQELGITEAIWMHSYGGRHPRKSHIKNDGKKYKIAKGWFDPDERKWVIPGELINCRCVSRSIVPGMIINKPDSATILVKRAAEAKAR